MKQWYPFVDLAIGTRFKYPGCDEEWVKIGNYDVAEWDEKEKVTGWTAQQLCSFDEENDVDRLVWVL